MRVIAGKAKGRRLSAPKTDKVRPAADKVKGALFNILGDLEGLLALDLFAGTGAVGIEALSRGAAECTFVESDRRIADFIRKNLLHCGFEESGQVLNMTVASALNFLSRKKRQFDLIFVDPPYDKGLVNRTLSLLEELRPFGEAVTVVIEHSPRELPETQEMLEIFDTRKYGQTLLSFLKLKG